MRCASSAGKTGDALDRPGQSLFLNQLDHAVNWRDCEREVIQYVAPQEGRHVAIDDLSFLVKEFSGDPEVPEQEKWRA